MVIAYSLIYNYFNINKIVKNKKFYCTGFPIYLIDNYNTCR